MRYTCRRDHISANVRVNYITKQLECHRHHCNAAILSGLSESGLWVAYDGVKYIKAPSLKVNLDDSKRDT